MVGAGARGSYHSRRIAFRSGVGAPEPAADARAPGPALLPLLPLPSVVLIQIVGPPARRSGGGLAQRRRHTLLDRAPLPLLFCLPPCLPHLQDDTCPSESDK
jgi:hypothetical protein